MATNSNIRHTLRQAVTRITVVCVCSLPAIPVTLVWCFRQVHICACVQTGANFVPSSWYLYQFWPTLKRLDFSALILTHAPASAQVSCSLPGLHSLSFTTCSITQQAAAELGIGSWPNLQHLNLCNSQLSLESSQTLLQGHWLLLRRLNVSHIPQQSNTQASNDYVLDNLLGQVCLPSLQCLKAEGWRDIRLSKIADKLCFPKLTSLTVSHLRWEPDAEVNRLRYLSLVGDTEPQCLYALLSLHLPGLQSLQIQSGSKRTWLCNDSRFADLVVQGKWPRLQSLKLYGHLLGLGDSMAAIAQASWQNLRWLDLSLNSLNATAIKCLVASSLPCLSFLNLSANLLGHSAMQHLVMGKWPSLQQLDLSNNGFGLETLHQHKGGRLACQHLVAAKTWPKLHTLQLVRCYIDVGALHILLQGRWAMLKLLDLSSNLLPTLSAETIGKMSRNQPSTCVFSDLLAQ